MRKICIILLFFLASAGVSAQSADAGFRQEQIDESRQASYRQKIGLDYSMPDYSVKKINAKKIGHRLANLLLYFEENYKQGIYNRKLAVIIAEQNEALVNDYFEVIKMKIVNISKTGNVIKVKYKATIDTKAEKKVQTGLLFCFTDGVSDSEKINEMFSNMSRYVSAREQQAK